MERFVQVWKRLLRSFHDKTHDQHSLDRWIESKHPTSPADVEFWIKEFDRRHSPVFNSSTRARYHTMA